MKNKKCILGLLVSLSLLVTSVLSLCAVAEESTNRVWISASQEVTQGNTYTGYVYADLPKNVASLNFSVYFNDAAFTVSNVDNQTECELYDSNVKEGEITFSYLFDGNAQGETCLCSFNFRVESDAAVGNQVFDLLVNDAYSASLTPIEINGSRFNCTVKEKTVSKTCTAYATSTVSSKIGNEFSISYRLSTKQIVGGAVQVQYDSELFEFVKFEAGTLLDNKLVDINANSPGSIYISFAGNEYSSGTNFFNVVFRTIGNLNGKSAIKLISSEFYNKELENIQCSPVTTTVALTYDFDYDESIPRMYLSMENGESDQLVVTVHLSEDSHLGAGDFLIKWDADIFSFSKCEKQISPTFFIIDDKSVESGKLGFSIISMTDIVAASDVLKLTLDITPPPYDISTEISIEGNGLSDSLTDPIELRFAGCNPTVTRAEPTATEPTATEPTATEPTATEPSATESSMTEPTSTQSSVTESSVTQPTATEPSVTQPTATEPIVTQPTATEPSMTAVEPTGTGADEKLLGDANDDGAVNMKDVLTLRKMLADMDVSYNAQNSDVNADGDVNMKDVLMLRKFLAGLIEKLG